MEFGGLRVDGLADDCDLNGRSKCGGRISVGLLCPEFGLSVVEFWLVDDDITFALVGKEVMEI